MTVTVTVTVTVYGVIGSSSIKLVVVVPFVTGRRLWKLGEVVSQNTRVVEDGTLLSSWLVSAAYEIATACHCYSVQPTLYDQLRTACFESSAVAFTNNGSSWRSRTFKARPNESN